MLTVLFSLGLSACSADDDGGATGGTGATTSGTPSGATDAGCVDLTGEGSVFTITISGLAYRPNCFTVNGSQTASIVNEDSVLHSFIIDGTEVDADHFEGGTIWTAPGPFSGVLEPGTYDFYCRYHEGMTGTVTVR